MSTYSINDVTDNMWWLTADYFTNQKAPFFWYEVVKMRTNGPYVCIAWSVKWVHCAQEATVDCTHSNPCALQSLESSVLVFFCQVAVWFFFFLMIFKIYCTFLCVGVPRRSVKISQNHEIWNPCQVTKHVAELHGSYSFKSIDAFHNWGTIFI